AAAAGIGVRVDAGRVPVLPETAAICGALGIDPLGLIGSGALLVAAPDAARTAAAITRAGVQAGEIGQFVPRGRLVVRAGREAPLPPPVGDELWRGVGGPGGRKGDRYRCAEPSPARPAARNARPWDTRLVQGFLPFP